MTDSSVGVGTRLSDNNHNIVAGSKGILSKGEIVHENAIGQTVNYEFENSDHSYWRTLIPTHMKLRVPHILRIIYDTIKDHTKTLDKISYESGSSGNWTWKKYSDHTVDLWYNGSFTFKRASAQFSATWWRSVQIITLPFQLEPRFVHSAAGTDNGGFFTTQTINNSRDELEVHAYSGNTRGYTANYTVEALNITIHGKYL